MVKEPILDNGALNATQLGMIGSAMLFVYAVGKFVNGFLLSKTDINGRITYCNEEFIEISGYTERELLGKPHNVVRHPDMPGTIFRYLWQRISKGKEVNAYIKNLAKDGSFYWVFANVSPSLDKHGERIVSYNSVRRKPSKEGMSFITKFYAELRKVEEAGIDVGLRWFIEYFEKRKDMYENFILSMQNEHTAQQG